MTRRRSTAESREAMSYLVSASKRTTNVRLPHDFVRNGDPPPLARLIRGGRGGEVRLKLYLTACMIATAPPYKYTRPTPALYWATALNLEDPAARGARRISDAFTWLHNNRYLDVDRRQGRPPTFQLLGQDLTTNPYSKPERDYVAIPIGLWSQHWIAKLTATEIAVLIAILDTRGDDHPDTDTPRYLTGHQKGNIGLAADTWTRATRTLTDVGLIEVSRRVQGGPLMYRRNRNIYRVTTALTQKAPA